MTSASRPVVIVGAGHAGGTLAGLLRQHGHEGPVVLVGHEPDPPYHRPPLSKRFVDGELEQWLRPAAFYDEQGIELRLGVRVTRIDRGAREVALDDGTVLPYETLVLATGADPRLLAVAGADLDGVLALRTLADARLLREAFAARRRLAIVGGGYVGLEVAAVARANDVPVTVLEREERVLARVASPELSEILTAHHRARGTEIALGAQVAGIVGDAGGPVRAVGLDDGSEVACDVVLVGVGAIPRDGLAREAGLTCDGGIVVDAATRTSDPSILAIGDVTRRPVQGAATPMRMESIPSAVEQARQAAAVIADRDVPEPDVPWFWSDQFDLKLKIAGLVRPGAHPVVRGDPASGRFALLHLEDGRLTAVESANAAGEFMAAKKLIASGVRVDPLRLADPDVALRDAAI